MNTQRTMTLPKPTTTQQKRMQIGECRRWPLLRTAILVPHSFRQVNATDLKIGYPQISFASARSSNELQRLELKIGRRDRSPKMSAERHVLHSCDVVYLQAPQYTEMTPVCYRSCVNNSNLVFTRPHIIS